MPRKMNNSHYYCSQNTLGPVEGGMNDTIRFQSGNHSVHYATLTGLENLKLAFSGMENLPGGEAVFVEMLACPGGCVSEKWSKVKKAWPGA